MISMNRDTGVDEKVECEVIGGYTVNPIASMFPLLQGKEFEDLVESIAHARNVTPIELHKGQLTDGRNRVRAVECLRERGIVIDLPTVEWTPAGDETIEEHIFSVNMYRRHLTDDQRAVLATRLLPQIRAARVERQASSRFGADASTAAAKTEPPLQPPKKGATSRAEKIANSTVGILARVAKVTPHKAARAKKLADSVKAGEVPAAELQAVLRGTKRLKQVALPKSRATKKSARKAKAARPTAEKVWDDADAGEATARDEAQDVSEAEVRRRWERWKGAIAIADHRELRRQMAAIIAAEQRAFDQ